MAQQVNSLNLTDGYEIFPGNSFTNNGSIAESDFDEPAIFTNGPVLDVVNSATGTVAGNGGNAFYFHDSVQSFLNDGEITHAGQYSAFFFQEGTIGSFINNNLISSSSGPVLNFDGDTTVTRFVNNAGGTISTTADNTAIEFGNTVTEFINGGLLQSPSGWTTVYIDDGAGSFTNQSSGVIENLGSGKALEFGGYVTNFSNAGALSSIDDVTIHFDGMITNFANLAGGTVTSTNNQGLRFNGAVTNFSNAGAVTAANQGVVFNNTVGTFTNLADGTIAGDKGLQFNDMVTNFTNGGDISGVGDWGAQFNSMVTNFANLAGGSIWSTNNQGIYFDSTVTNFTNAGAISGGNGTGIEFGQGGTNFTNAAGGSIVGNGGDGVYVSNGEFLSFANYGTISSLGVNVTQGVRIKGGVTSFVNGGTIHSASSTGVIIFDPVASFVNTGTIDAPHPTNTTWGLNFVGGVVYPTNSGTIRGGENGHSILMGGGTSNKLTILTGSELYGIVEFDGGADTFDFSSFYGTAVIDTDSFTVTGPGDDTIVAGSRAWADLGGGVIAIFDPTGAANVGGTTASDSVGAIRDVIGGQLGGATGVTDTVIENAYVAGPDLGDAADAANDTAVMSDLDVGLPAPTGNTRVWASAFGGMSADNAPVALSNLYGGLVAGAHTAVAEQTLLGALAAYTRSNFAVATDEQTIVTDTGIVGLYGETDLGVVKLDFSLLGGASLHNSTRRVVVVNVLETATASFSSWFVSPGLGVELPVLSEQGMQVNVAASTSAILGSTSGYTEAVTGGGGGGIAVGSLPIAIWDGRIELNGEKVVGATSTGGEVTVSGKAGLMAQANIGGSTLPISFNGVANANPYVAPNSAAIGAYAGFGLAIEIGDGANVTFDANGSIRSDGVASLGASAGIGGSF